MSAIVPIYDLAVALPKRKCTIRNSVITTTTDYKDLGVPIVHFIAVLFSPSQQHTLQTLQVFSPDKMSSFTS